MPTKNSKQVLESFARRFPGVKLGELRIAKGRPTEELRNMNVGDIVRFPLEKYSYRSMRAIMCNTLVNERLIEGRMWASALDGEACATTVMRVS